MMAKLGYQERSRGDKVIPVRTLPVQVRMVDEPQSLSTKLIKLILDERLEFVRFSLELLLQSQRHEPHEEYRLSNTDCHRYRKHQWLHLRE